MSLREKTILYLPNFFFVYSYFGFPTDLGMHLEKDRDVPSGFRASSTSLI